MNKYFFLLVLSFFSFASFSQIIKINDAADSQSSNDLQTLIQNVLITGTCAQINNFTEQVSGVPTAIQTKSYGYFKKPTGSNFPFDSGIVLSTGRAAQGGNTTNANLVDYTLNLPGDNDLQTALGIFNTHDATYVKFEFTPYTTDISFNFLMASEEYDGNTECNNADGFAFLLRKVGTTNYTNMAVLPNGTPVSVTNINDSNSCRANEEYFAGYNLPDTNYGGRTKVLTARANVIPNQVYEMKIVVADEGNASLDSAIFLEEGSFYLGVKAAKPEDIPKLAACDDTSYGSTFDGYNLFDLEDRKTVILNGSSDTDYTLTYFTDDQYTNQIPTADINSYQNTSQLQTIYVQMTNNNDANCWDRTSFEIEVYKLPVITSPVLFRQCDDDTDGIALMDLTLANSYVSDDSENESFTYFTSQTDAENNNIAQSIPNPQNYISGNNTLWVRVETVHHCYVVGQVDIDVSVTNTAYNKTITLCDDFIDDIHNDYDGISEFDLTQVSNDVLALFPVADRPNLNITFYPSIDDALLQTNLIEHPNKYRNTTNTTLTTPERIYIRVENKNNLDCAGMGLDLYIDLIVETKPYFEIQDQLLCNNLLPTPLEVRVENYQALYDYTWTDANGNTLQTDPTFSGIAYVTSPGEHTVVATSPNGCEKTHTFNVQLSSLPIIKTLTVFDDLPKNRISVIVTGDGDYEYALDNDAFVDGNELNGHIFYNVDEGLHTIHINDKNGCTPVVDREVMVIRFPKYISPNHDGKHDVFYVYGGDDFAVSSLTIFDRYGKIIKVLKQNEKWDGTYLGKVALPTDYWFLAKFIDHQGKTYERSGHFSVTF